MIFHSFSLLVCISCASLPLSSLLVLFSLSILVLISKPTRLCSCLLKNTSIPYRPVDLVCASSYDNSDIRQQCFLSCACMPLSSLRCGIANLFFHVLRLPTVKLSLFLDCQGLGPNHRGIFHSPPFASRGINTLHQLSAQLAIVLRSSIRLCGSIV